MVVAARRVAIDTSFGADDHLTALPTLGHQLPKSSFIDELKLQTMHDILNLIQVSL